MAIEVIITFLSIKAQEIVCYISNWTEVDPTGLKTSKWTEQSLRRAPCCEQGLQEKVLKQCSSKLESGGKVVLILIQTQMIVIVCSAFIVIICKLLL